MPLIGILRPRVVGAGCKTLIGRTAGKSSPILSHLNDDQLPFNLKTAVEHTEDLQKPGCEKLDEEGGLSLVDLVSDSESFYRQDLAKIRHGQLPF